MTRAHRAYTGSRPVFRSVSSSSALRHGGMRGPARGARIDRLAGRLWRRTRGSPGSQPAALDPVHRAVVSQLHPDGARFVPSSGGRRACPSIVRAPEAAVRRPRATGPRLQPFRAAGDDHRRPEPRDRRHPQGYLGPAEFDAFLCDCLARVPGKAARIPARRPAQTGSPARSPTKSVAEPKNEERLALSGYCPVSLICDRKLVPGQTEYTVRHEGGPIVLPLVAMSDRFRARARALHPRQRWHPVRSASWSEQGTAGRPAVGRALRRVTFSLCRARKTGAGSSKTPTATRWSTSPSRVFACTAFASRDSWSAATRATRSPAEAGGTGFRIPVIVMRFSPHCAEKEHMHGPIGGPRSRAVS